MIDIEKILAREYSAKEEYKSIVNGRQLLVKDFLDALNEERKGTHWKQLDGRAVAMKLKNIKTEDLHAFYQKCRNYQGGFGKMFFGCLKLKEITQRDELQ